MPEPDRYRALAPGMRTLLVVAGVLVFLAGVQLFVFPLRTERYFAWTIQPPMTAVFLGASYWSSLAFEWSAARQRRWADARIAVPTVFVFTLLTLIVTLVHRDRFHFDATNETSTRAITWAWLAIYAVVPILMAVLWARQARAGGIDAPRSQRLPWSIRIVIGAESALLLGVGSALMAAPEHTAGIWPWALSPLTARAVAAWCLGLGVAAAHAVWEDDVPRLRPAATAFITFGVLQAIALARHGGDLHWDRPVSYVYVGFLVSAATVGTAVLVLGSQEQPADTPL